MIRFTQPKYFNDHFDTKFNLKRSIDEQESINMFGKDGDLNAAELIKLAKQYGMNYKKLERLTPEDLYIMKNKMVNPTKAMRKLILESFNNFISESFGILCLTTEPTNKTMWAHYSKENAGFIIIFNNEHPYFNNGLFRDRDVGKLQKVYYTNEPLIPDNIMSKEMREVFFTKDIVWAEENEWRMILPLEMATNVKNSIYLFGFLPEIITGIIFGLRTEESTINKIKSLCAEDRYKHLKLYQVRAIEDSYDLEVVSYNS
jgi:hypothetical protein